MSAPVPTGKSDFVVVANRLPVDLERLPDGSQRWRRSPGGLVTALEPILRAKSGAWVGWPGIADVQPAPFTEDGLYLRPVPLSAEDIEEYYEGFSNATLWPLYHDCVVPPEYHREWWTRYKDVNLRFARAAAESAAPGATVWVQDYQLQLVPKMIRELRPDLTIGYFLHIPFPPVELFQQLPWRREIIEGLMGADVVGFQLPGGAKNFLFLARHLTGAQATGHAVGVRSKFGTITLEDRTVTVGAFPISIDAAEMDGLAKTDEVKERAAKLRQDLGNPSVILLGVDRLDYTKGIDIRLKALYELFHEGKLDPRDVAMVQIATPSRERVEQYQVMRNAIEQSVGRINGEFGDLRRAPITYFHRGVPRRDLVAFYAAADVMVVTPVRDGMNLVAKEYVASHRTKDGAVVLSEFTGAAYELQHAYLCNPHDLEGVKQALVDAVEQSPAEARRRMGALRRQVLTNTVTVWADSFLATLFGQPQK